MAESQLDCNSSLTAMDWLPRLSVGGAMASAAGKAGQHGSDTTGKLNGGCQALRKAPNSPLDTNATLDTSEAQHHQQKDGKPPYSYANLITFAINSSHKKKMTLSEIYAWICENFPYYNSAGNGWKVRLVTQIYALDRIRFEGFKLIARKLGLMNLSMFLSSKSFLMFSSANIPLGY